jgi:hypothetical protein
MPNKDTPKVKSTSNPFSPHYRKIHSSVNCCVKLFCVFLVSFLLSFAFLAFEAKHFQVEIRSNFLLRKRGFLQSREMVSESVSVPLTSLQSWSVSAAQPISLPAPDESLNLQDPWKTGLLTKLSCLSIAIERFNDEQRQYQIRFSPGVYPFPLTDGSPTSQFARNKSSLDLSPSASRSLLSVDAVSDSSDRDSSVPDISIQQQATHPLPLSKYARLSSGRNDSVNHPLPTPSPIFKYGINGIYLYHVRKAAGTSLRTYFQDLSYCMRVSFYETEGKVLNSQLLSPADSNVSLLSVISFRNPIDRIISLYWYEYVSWYYNVVKKPEKIHSLSEWISAWKDNASHKSLILKKLPRNNYIEIENYYIKLLIGHSYNVSLAHSGLLQPKITREDLEKAKRVLEKFDFIFISEELGKKETSQRQLLKLIYDRYCVTSKEKHAGFAGIFGRSLNDKDINSFRHETRGNYSMRAKLKPLLMPREVIVVL